MRILNASDLQSDVQNTFLTNEEDDPRFVGWVRHAWIRWFTREHPERFVPVQVRETMFSGLGEEDTPKSGVGLYVKPIGVRQINIYEFTRYDVKDARARTLLWYTRVASSLLIQDAQDLMLVRSYLYARYINPSADQKIWTLEEMKRLSWPETLVAANRWFEDMMKEQERERARLRRLQDTLALRSTDLAPAFSFKIEKHEYQAYSIVSPFGLTTEGLQMSHCVGGYWDLLMIARDKRIITIRSADNITKPLVTIEADVLDDGMHYVQFQGPHNTNADIAVPHITDWFRQNKMLVRESLLRPECRPEIRQNSGDQVFEVRLA